MAGQRPTRRRRIVRVTREHFASNIAANTALSTYANFMKHGFPKLFKEAEIVKWKNAVREIPPGKRRTKEQATAVRNLRSYYEALKALQGKLKQGMGIKLRLTGETDLTRTLKEESLSLDREIRAAERLLNRIKRKK